MVSGSFLGFISVLLLFSFSLRVADVLELLQAAGILLGGEDAVVLVDCDSDERLKLAGKIAVFVADVGQQLAVAIEDL